MADPSIAALQKTVNRYAAAGGFTPLKEDGDYGTKTRQGVYDALAWIANAQIDQALRSAAATHVAQWSGSNDARLALIAVFLANVANSLHLQAGGGVAVLPGGGGGGSTVPTYPALPAMPGSGLVANMRGSWDKLPTWGKMLAGILGGFGLLLGITKIRKRKTAMG